MKTINRKDFLEKIKKGNKYRKQEFRKQFK